MAGYEWPELKYLSRDWGEGGRWGWGEMECEEASVEQGEESIIPERRMDEPTSYLVIIISQKSVWGGP
jgi:hypothetical protein